MDVLVVVIDAKVVTPTSSLADDDIKACAPAHFDRTEEAPKTRVVCAVLDRNHFSLGVVRAPEVRAIFQLGPDWDAARHLILGFIKARKSPSVPLCPQWGERHSASESATPESTYASSPQHLNPTSADQRPVLSLETKKNTENFGETEGGGIQVCSVSCLSSPVRNPPLRKKTSTAHAIKHPQRVSGGMGLGDEKNTQEEKDQFK